VMTDEPNLESQKPGMENEEKIKRKIKTIE
jgi:hypothetical protein